MADYTTITAAETDPGKPVSSALVKALEENPRAMMFGATGAPRLQIAALANPAAGDLIKIERLTTASTTSTSFVSVLRFYIMQTGTIRITYEYRMAGAATAFAQVTLDGTQVQTASTASGTFQSVTTDQAVDAGELVSVEVRTNSGTQAAEIRNVRIRTSGAYILPFFASNIENINP